MWDRRTLTDREHIGASRITSLAASRDDLAMEALVGRRLCIVGPHCAPSIRASFARARQVANVASTKMRT
jgi:hypothetical protein